MAENDTDLAYRCTRCDERVRARVIESGGFTNGFTIGCACTTVDSCPMEMGQRETPDRWVVERPPCCRGVDGPDLDTIHEEFADVECPECGWKYSITGEVVSRPDEDDEEAGDRAGDKCDGTGADDGQHRLMTDGGRDNRVEEAETGVRLDRHDEWPDEEWEDNVLFGDFLRGSSHVIADLLKDSDVPKFSHEGGTTVLGPLDELTPTMLYGAAKDAAQMERYCSDDRDHEGAKRYGAARAELERLGTKVREHHTTDEAETGTGEG